MSTNVNYMSFVSDSGDLKEKLLTNGSSGDQSSSSPAAVSVDVSTANSNGKSVVKPSAESPTTPEWKGKARRALHVHAETKHLTWDRKSWNVFMAFPKKEDEKAFQYYFAQLRGRKMQGGLLLMTFLYIIFALTTWKGETWESAVVVRATYMLFLVLGFSFTFSEFYQNHIQGYSSVLSIVTGVEIILEGALRKEIYSPFVIITLIVYLFFGTNVVGLRMAHTACVSLTLVLLYDLLALSMFLHGDHDITQDQVTGWMVWYNFILVTVAIMTIVLGRRMEIYRRQEFLTAFRSEQTRRLQLTMGKDGAVAFPVDMAEQLNRIIAASLAATAGGSRSVRLPSVTESGSDPASGTHYTALTSDIGSSEQKEQASKQVQGNPVRKSSRSSGLTTPLGPATPSPSLSLDVEREVFSTDSTSLGNHSDDTRTESSTRNEESKSESSGNAASAIDSEDFQLPPPAGEHQPFTDKIGHVLGSLVTLPAERIIALGELFQKLATHSGEHDFAKLVSDTGANSVTSYLRSDTEVDDEDNTPLRHHYELCDHTQLPAYFSPYPYVFSGYRVRFSQALCTKSMLKMHNETINIHTETIPFFAFLVTALTYVLFNETFNNATQTDQIFVVIGLLGALVLRPLASGLAHAYYCQSKKKYVFWWGVDYASICVAVLSAALVFGRFSFYCAFQQQLFYYFSVVGLFCSTIVSVLWVASPSVRAGSFCLFVMFANGMPFFYQVALKLEGESANDVPTAYLPYWFGVMACLVTGLIIKSTMVPERCAPGKFDVWGYSHQVWHVCINVAHLLLLLTWTEYLAFREVTPC